MPKRSTWKPDMAKTQATIADLDPEPATVTDDVHSVVADVRAAVAEALAPLKKVVATPYRLLGTTDLLVVVTCFEAAAHVLINHIEGVIQPEASSEIVVEEPPVAANPDPDPDPPAA